MNNEQKELLNEILDYLIDSESLDFEEQCHENNVQYSDIIFNDDHRLTNHIYYKTIKLRYLLTKD